MIEYMACMAKNNDDNSLCRLQSKDYLECRMNNNLMAKEEWKNLGFRDLVSNENKDKESQDKK